MRQASRLKAGRREVVGGRRARLRVGDMKAAQGSAGMTIEIGQVMTKSVGMGEPEGRRAGCRGRDLDLWEEETRRHGLVAFGRAPSV